MASQRHETAKKIHALIMQCSRSHSKHEFDANKDKLKDVLSGAKVSSVKEAFKEVSVDYFTLLHDILHLVSKNCRDESLREYIGTSLLDLFIEEADKVFVSQDWTELLSVTTRNRFNILQLAVNTGSLKIVNAIIKRLTMPEQENALRINLGSITKERFTVLHTATNTAKPEIVNAIIELLTIPGQENLLQINLEIFTNEQFTLLQTAVRTGKPEIVNSVTRLLKSHLSQDALKTQLKHANNAKYNILHSAALTNNPEIFFYVISLMLFAFADEFATTISELAKQTNERGCFPSSQNDRINFFIASYCEHGATNARAYLPAYEHNRQEPNTTVQPNRQIREQSNYRHKTVSSR